MNNEFVDKDYENYVKWALSESARIRYEVLKCDVKNQGNEIQMTIFKHILEKYHGGIK